MISKKENTYNIYVEDDNGNSITTDTIHKDNTKVNLTINLVDGKDRFNLYTIKDSIVILSKLLTEVVKHFE